MKIKTCDMCRIIKTSPIMVVSVPTMDDGEHVTMRKLDMCPECLEAMALNISAYLNENMKKGSGYEF